LYTPLFNSIVERERLIKEGSINANERTGLLRSDSAAAGTGAQYGSLQGTVPTTLPARMGVVSQDAQIKMSASPQGLGTIAENANGNGNQNGQANGGH
jgi:hypothetical protein